MGICYFFHSTSFFHSSGNVAKTQPRPTCWLAHAKFDKYVIGFFIQSHSFSWKGFYSTITCSIRDALIFPGGMVMRSSHESFIFRLGLSPKLGFRESGGRQTKLVQHKTIGSFIFQLKCLRWTIIFKYSTRTFFCCCQTLSLLHPRKKGTLLHIHLACNG